jgi:hypothetical protein
MSNQQNRRGRTECVLLQPASERAGGQDAAQPGGTGDNQLTRADRAVISQYFEGRWRRTTLAPQSGRRTRRRWIIGGKLPANVPTSALPVGLTEKLSPLDEGYERLLAGNDVLCVEIATMKIVDVMRDAGSEATSDTAHLLLGYPANHALPVGNGTA